MNMAQARTPVKEEITYAGLITGAQGLPNFPAAAVEGYVDTNKGLFMNTRRFARLTLQAVAFTVLGSSGHFVAQAQEARSDPAQAYMEFHDQLPGAKTLDQMSKYFSRTRWAQMSKDEQNLPKAQFEMMFELFKKLSPQKVSLVSQSLIGDVCILTLKSQDADKTSNDLLSGRATDPTSGPTNNLAPTMAVSSTGTGTVTMRKEDGQWKIEMEEWQCSEIIGEGAGSTSGAGKVPEKGHEPAFASSSLDAAAAAK
jgi:hypothetical protein